MRGKAIKNDAKAEENGALLAAILLHRHGLGIDKLYKHQDWSGKYCPAYILPHWEQFKSKVEANLNEIKAAEQAAQEKPTDSGKTLCWRMGRSDECRRYCNYPTGHEER